MTAGPKAVFPSLIIGAVPLKGFGFILQALKQGKVVAEMTEEKPVYPAARAQYKSLGWARAMVGIFRDNGIVGVILLILAAPTIIASTIVGIFLWTIRNAIFGRPETGVSRTSDRLFEKIHLGCTVIAMLFNIYFLFKLLEIVLS